jgi:hypothetical protein
MPKKKNSQWEIKIDLQDHRGLIWTGLTYLYEILVIYTVDQDVALQIDQNRTTL